MNNTLSLKTKIALLLTIVLWASAFVGIRAGLESYSPGGLAILRFMIASVCMFVIYLRFAKRDSIPLKDKIRLLCMGAGIIGVYNIALNYGEISVPSGVASFIICQSSIVSVIFAVIFLSENFSILSAVGMVISVLGVLLISLGKTQGFHFDMGMIYVLIATVVGAFNSILQKPFLKKYHAIDVTAYMVWGGTLTLSVFFPELVHDVSKATLHSTLAIVYLGIFPAAIAYVTWNYVLAAIPASRAVNYLYFMPVITTFLGWIWLNEVPVMLSFIGGLIALFGVWVVNYSYVKPSSPALLPSQKALWEKGE